MKAPDYIVRTARMLCDAGFEAYAVGGCVRDSLMGKAPDDWDMTTNASPDEMKAVFAGMRVIETGIRHGTLTVLTDGIPVEITAYRTEGTYSDNRHPDYVHFTKELHEDLSRRDFTVNAMAYDPVSGEITDMFGGKADIESRTIRCVGDPDRRFGEDALRILRALRFSSVLGFSIEEETAQSIIRNRELIKNLSVERIYAELKKMILGRNIYNVMMKFACVFAVFIPEIEKEIGFDQQNYHHIYSLWEHTAYAVHNASDDIFVRLCMLFHDCGKPFCQSFDEDGTAHYYSHSKISAELTRQAFSRLKSDKKTAETVVTLVENHDAPIPDSEKLIKRRLRRFGEENFFRLIEVHKADTSALNPAYTCGRAQQLEDIRMKTEEILREQQCFSLKDLAINGKDVQSLGFSGREIGEKLELLLNAVTDGRVRNEHESLLAYIRR